VETLQQFTERLKQSKIGYSLLAEMYFDCDNQYKELVNKYIELKNKLNKIKKEKL